MMQKAPPFAADVPAPALEALLADYAERQPEIVFEWHDAQSPARGFLVINSLRGGAAGGGTRMRPGLNREEVISLAKTMEVKFTVSGPAIGGGKSGIDFNPTDPRKEAVLRRWFQAVGPLLAHCYGTGGDLNVDEIREVIPQLEAQGIAHPQQGIVVGHFGTHDSNHKQRMEHLRRGVKQRITDPALTPAPGRYAVADLITGYGVAEAIHHYYALWRNDTPLQTQRVMVQGWGNVAAATAYYLSAKGAKIVGIIDRAGGRIAPHGIPHPEICELVTERKKQSLPLHHKDSLTFEQTNARIWDTAADIFIPAAASRLLTKEHIQRLAAAGVQLLASGANVPFAEQETFYGPVTQQTDAQMAILPDFIASAAMARVFAYLMEAPRSGAISDAAIFADCSQCMLQALKKLHPQAPTGRYLMRVALHEALQQLLAAS